MAFLPRIPTKIKLFSLFLAVRVLCVSECHAVGGRKKRKLKRRMETTTKQTKPSRQGKAGRRLSWLSV